MELSKLIQCSNLWISNIRCSKSNDKSIKISYKNLNCQAIIVLLFVAKYRHCFFFTKAIKRGNKVWISPNLFLRGFPLHQFLKISLRTFVQCEAFRINWNIWCAEIWMCWTCLMLYINFPNIHFEIIVYYNVILTINNHSYFHTSSDNLHGLLRWLLIYGVILLLDNVEVIPVPSPHADHSTVLNYNTENRC